MIKEQDKISCLRLIQGDCGGCPILKMAEEKIARTPRGQEPIVIQKVQKTYCPTGENIGISKRREPPIWQV